MIKTIKELKKEKEDLKEEMMRFDKEKEEEWISKCKKYKEEVGKQAKEKEDLKNQLKTALQKVSECESKIVSLEEDIEIKKEENEELEKELKAVTRELNIEQLCKKLIQNETLSKVTKFTESQNKEFVAKNKRNKKVMKV